MQPHHALAHRCIMRDARMGAPGWFFWAFEFGVPHMVFSRDETQTRLLSSQAVLHWNVESAR